MNLMIKKSKQIIVSILRPAPRGEDRATAKSLGS